MQTEPDPDIRRHPDGSIDTAYYMQQGRIARSRQARHLAKKVVKGVKAERRTPALTRLFQGLMPQGRLTP